MNYVDFFANVLGGTDKHQPYLYQQRLADGPWPNLLNAPTGTGKTKAIAGAWLYRRYCGDTATPTRIVICLPMRTLVEQTVNGFQEWLKTAESLFRAKGMTPPRVFTVMGGVCENGWIERPEDPSVLVGTQDQLESGALMRRFGASRYAWPMHFALLHNDALWIYDEVQLMGPGAATSAQLDAFRRQLGCARPSHSLWMSATLNPGTLDTVDFAPYQASLNTLTLSDEERRSPAMRKLIQATKALTRATVLLDSESAKKKAAPYIEALCSEIRAQHQSGTNTVVIVNTVERAQATYGALTKASIEAEVTLIHSRFRSTERQRLNTLITKPPPTEGRIIVATQAIEAGVDISSSTLITELAPWSSLVQRFGRCNRYGEYNTDGANIFWVDVADDFAAPYPAELFTSARTRLHGLHSAAPADLPADNDPSPPTEVIRQRDFLDLFDTDPDLSGYDLDVSRYIRDTDDTDVMLFWRDLSSPDREQPPPAADELCRVSIAQASILIKRLQKTTLRPQVWDPLTHPAGWRTHSGTLRPGMTLMLDSRVGGYTTDLGFSAAAKKPVPVVEAQATEHETESDEADDLSRFPQGRAVELGTHLADAEDAAIELCRSLNDEATSAVVPTAARGHDTGKAHAAFQSMILRNDSDADTKRSLLWAKGVTRGRSQYTVQDIDGNTIERKYFRHELASMLAWIAHHPDHPKRDLIAYLIAAHHGKVRMRLRSLPGETEPSDRRLFARGVWSGDLLPPIDITGREQLPETRLDLDLMQLGEGPQGPSWTARTATLLREYGPFRLAWLETLVRIADWRASRQEQENRE